MKKLLMFVCAIQINLFASCCCDSSLLGGFHAVKSLVNDRGDPRDNGDLHLVFTIRGAMLSLENGYDYYDVFFEADETGFISIKGSVPSPFSGMFLSDFVLQVPGVKGLQNMTEVAWSGF